MLFLSKVSGTESAAFAGAVRASMWLPWQQMLPLQLKHWQLLLKAASLRATFWVRLRCLQAIRGGGPLYGIVTSWTVKLHKAPAKVLASVQHNWGWGHPRSIQ